MEFDTITPPETPEQTRRVRAALPGSIAWGLSCVLCPIATTFSNRFGSRIAIPLGCLISALGILGSAFAPNIYFLSFTYNVLVALGSSLVSMCSFTIIPLYFDRYRSTATGIIITCYSAGLVIVSPISHIIMDNYGWRRTMMALGGINLVAGILAFPISRKPLIDVKEKEQKMTKKGLKSTLCSSLSSFVDYLSTLKNPNLILVLVLSVPFYLGWYMPTVHLCGLVLMAIADFLMPLATNVGHLYGYAVTQGICEGLFCTSIICLAISAQAQVGITWFNVVCTIPMFTGPLLAGYIADSSGSYHPVFYTSGCSLLAAALISFLRHCIRKQSVNLSNDVGWFGKILSKNKHKDLWKSTTTVISVTELD